MSIYYIFILLMFAVILYLKWNFTKIKGKVGEYYTNKALSKLSEDTYQIYHDLYLPTEDGKTTQLDHIVTSNFGIFVIETKHYDGWIFGSEKQRYWTQVLYKRKEKMLNPIWQNYGHIKALQYYLGKTENDLFHNIVAFSASSTFKFKEEFKSAKVIKMSGLTKVIQANTEQVLTDQELIEINSQLDKLVITDRKERKHVEKEHIKSIKESKLERTTTSSAKNVQSPKEANKDSLVCPKCSGDLIERKGKYGGFIGCTNYPKCKYTEKVS